MLLTLDYFANLVPQYKKKGVDLKSFFMADWSRGNLGVVAKPNIKSIEALKDAKVATRIAHACQSTKATSEEDSEDCDPSAETSDASDDRKDPDYAPVDGNKKVRLDLWRGARR